MSDEMFTMDFINEKGCLARSSFNAKDDAKRSMAISDDASNSWREWDEAGELLYLASLEKIKQSQTRIAELEREIGFRKLANFGMREQLDANVQRIAELESLVERLVEVGQRLADETESYDDIMAWELVNDEAQRLMSQRAGDKLAEGE